MNLLVCISKTPDTTSRIAFKNNNTAFDDSGVQFIMNPFDEFYSLVRALELQEQFGGTVTVLNVGDNSNDIIIRKALAIGAHKAVRINAQPLSAHFTAFQIAEYAKDKSFDIIFFGKETIDFNGGEVQSMVAESLGLPFVHLASHLTVEGNVGKLNRDIEGGVEKIEVEIPFVVSASKGMAEQRIPSMKGIMMAKSKPLDVIEAFETKDMVETIKYEIPAEKSGIKMVDPENVEELVRLLHEEAKVI
ncbi:MAG: electron transfer flavoprotein subunit beta/FixA family protein [Deltaproteobacteria bacterium]